jgi:hypothetical protein
MLNKYFTLILRILIVPPSLYSAYVIGCLSALLLVEPSGISTVSIYDLIITFPKSVILISYVLLGLPFIAELTGLLYIYTGRKDHLLWAALFVTWKSFLILCVALVGGKGV